MKFFFMQKKFLFSALIFGFAISTQAQNAAPFWSLGGNSNATSASKLGTTNANPLILRTNNSSRLYIAPDGKVGIGTSSPTTQFHVEGLGLVNIFVSTVAPGLQSGSGLIGYMKGTPTASGQRLGYFLTGAQGGGTNPYNATGMAGYADGAWTDASRPAYIAFETTQDGSMTRSERMRISSLGHVGIGTSDPGYKLEVVDGSNFSSAIRADGAYNGIIATGGSIGLIAGTHNGAGTG